MSDYKPYQLEYYRPFAKEGSLSVDLTPDHQAMVLKIDAKGIYALDDIDEALLKAVISRLADAIKA